jgi:hypothetical protein
MLDGELRHVVDLNGGEGLDMDVGEVLLELVDDIGVVLNIEIRHQAAHNVKLAGARAVGLFDPRHNIVGAAHVGIGLVAVAAEGAEVAVEGADIGRRDAVILDKVHRVAVQPPVHQIR